MVAVGEAVTNCMKHAYHGAKDGRIMISSSLAEGYLNVHIRDWGETFDTGLYNAPDLGEAHEGGYGVFLMKEMTDRLEIRTDTPPGTEIILGKRLPPDDEVGRH